MKSKHFFLLVVAIAWVVEASGNRNTGIALDLQQYIDEAISKGNKTITIPPGTYRVTPHDKTHLSFNDLNDITIIAEGVEMICTETTRAITFNGCKNMTLKGLIIDYDPLCFTQGVITKLGADKTFIEFKLDDGYPDNLVERIEIFDSKTLHLKRATHYGWGRFEKIGNRQYRVGKGNNYKYNPDIDKEEVGDILVTNNDYTPNGNEPHAIYSDQCTNLKLEDITLYSGNCFGFFETNGTKNTYIRCKIDRRSPETDLYERKKRIRSNDADAFHSKFAYIGPQLIECSARYQGDDGINICGKYYFSVGGKGKNIRLVIPHSCSLQVGNQLELLTIEGKRLPECTVVNIEEDGKISQQEINSIAQLKQNEGNKRALTRSQNKILKITVDKEVDFPLGTIVGNIDQKGDGFLIKNCNFSYNRSRGILIKASNGKVIGNVLEANAMHSVLITPEAWWLESGSSDNVEVRDNIIIRNGAEKAISIEGMGFIGDVPPAGLHNNIIIENNKFSDCIMPCIYMASTKGGTIRNNDYYFPVFNKMTEPVLTVNCEDITITQSQQSDKMIVTTDNTYNPDLGNGYYMNPVLKGDWGDPTVVRDGNDYYMTNHSASLGTPSMLIWHSRDLVNWEPITYALNENLGQSVWAADFIKHGELFYIYLPVPSKNTNYVITAPHPAGPWSKAIDLKVSGIDPGHIATPEGKRYLHVDNGYMVELAPDGLSVISEKKKVYDGWQYPSDWIVECFCLESPKLTYRNGWYYLTVAQGGTAGPPTGHMVASSRSRTPFGPWEHNPYNPIVKTKSRTEKWASMGHGTLVDTPQNEWFIIFHAYDNNARHLGRQVLMLPVEWTEDGWFKIPEGADVAEPLKKTANGTIIHNKMQLSDNFSGSTIGLQWKMMGGDIRERVSVNNGALMLKATGTSPSDSNPVVIDPMNDYYQVEIDVMPGKTNKTGLLFYSHNRYMGLELDGSTIYRLTGNGYSREQIKDVENNSPVRFRLSNDHNDLLYWYSIDNGKNWTRIDFVNNLTNWGGGTIRPGVYATGTGEALFKNFTYKGIQ